MHQINKVEISLFEKGVRQCRYCKYFNYALYRNSQVHPDPVDIETSAPFRNIALASEWIKVIMSNENLGIVNKPQK